MKKYLALFLLLCPVANALVINPTTPTRAVNTNFTPSAIYNVNACYTFSASVSASLAANVTASINFLSDTATTPTTVRCSFSVGTNLTLGVALGFTNSQISECCYIVPKGHVVRLAVTSGTVTIVNQVEELFMPEFDGVDFTTGFPFK